MGNHIQTIPTLINTVEAVWSKVAWPAQVWSKPGFSSPQIAPVNCQTISSLVQLASHASQLSPDKTVSNLNIEGTYQGQAKPGHPTQGRPSLVNSNQTTLIVLSIIQDRSILIFSDSPSIAYLTRTMQRTVQTPARPHPVWSIKLCARASQIIAGQGSPSQHSPCFLIKVWQALA